MPDYSSQKSICNIDPATIRINKISPSTTDTESASSITAVHPPQQPQTNFLTEPYLVTPLEASLTYASNSSAQAQTDPILSDIPLTEWRGSVTTFAGISNTRPARELKDAIWTDISKQLSPGRPLILSEKKDGVFAVPCLLKDAPLTGNTLAIAKFKGFPVIGKMRSKDHVTEATFLMADVDGIPEAALMSSLELLRKEGITYVAYTTFSHGSTEKPGMRVRLIIPIDRPVTPEEYSSAWHGLDKRFLAGEVSKKDSSGARMYQAQGAWCCHPSRIQQANSWHHNAGIASADALIAIGQAVYPPVNITTQETDEDTPEQILPTSIILALLAWIEADLPYMDWLKVLMAIFYITRGSPEGLEIADTWSSRGIKYKGYREIANKWRSFRLDISNPITERTLIMMARNAGADVSAIMHGDAFEICESEGGADESDPVAPPERSPVLTPIAAMQQKFGLINFGGKLCVFDREALGARTAQNTARKLFLSNRSDGSLLIERAIIAEFPNAIDPNRMVSAFFVNPDTVCYHGTEFNPQGTSPKYLNLWEGPTIIPVEGQWLLIQEFLHDVICNGDWGSYLYLIMYIAHALQQPEDKPGVMIILLSGQGTGKGTLGRILQKVWSATYIQVNNIDAVIGTFNAVLERAYIVFMDEALFAGNRRGTDELKSIVTEPIIQISEKYQPSRQIRSCHRFFAATNADHFKNTERDDRRDFTLRVSEARKGDHEYWKVLNDEIDNGGVEAMVHDLLLMDLSNFNVRNKPNTRELVEQKLHSLDPIQRWWHDGLYNGALSGQDSWPEFISTADAITGIIEVNGGRMHKKPSAIIISQAMVKICPGAKSHQMQSHFSRHRGYLLPSLQQARAEFERYMGGVVDWPLYQDVGLQGNDDEDLTDPY